MSNLIITDMENLSKYYARQARAGLGAILLLSQTYSEIELIAQKSEPIIQKLRDLCKEDTQLVLLSTALAVRELEEIFYNDFRVDRNQRVQSICLTLIESLKD